MENLPIRKAEWKGPYSWPGFEAINGLPSIPPFAGVYLQTFRHAGGYLIYGAGLTRRHISIRFREHARGFKNGEYTVLDLSSAENGIRCEIWHGWGYAREHRGEFEERKSEILEAVDNLLNGFRIFVTDLNKEPRIHERIEAAVMTNLYQQLPPISELPDRGMQLSGRKNSEPLLILNNVCQERLYGLPNYLAA